MKFLIVAMAFALGMFALYYWIYTMVHILKNEVISSGEKVAWLFGVVFFPLVGTILYWAISNNHNKPFNDNYRDSEIVPNPL